MKRILTAITAASVTLLNLTACSGARVLESLAPSESVAVTRDVVFDAERELSLDVYRPVDATDAPVVVFFWGGSWQSGDRSTYGFLGRTLASRGLVVMIPDYRVYPEVRYPAFLCDSARAVAWAREQATAYGGDPARLSLLGHSAGAYNAAMLVTDARYLESVGGGRDWIASWAGLAGPYDFLPLNDATLERIFEPADPLASSQPVNWVDADVPPTLLVVSADDPVVDPRNTERLARRLEQSGVPVELLRVDNLRHAGLVISLSNVFPFGEEVLATVSRFLLGPATPDDGMPGPVHASAEAGTPARCGVS
ncbi:alpha/beta hydrolase [Guyparkeria sp. SB14A]|uniref:alpha/beta hydrolase n=1 Tax=Guyparkeria sp. SB14A TaxID=2571147 RepID=UPI0010AC1E62|nr:alpha/beta hydrolase [Guyparkeria sp. SB14A]TKA88806.1 alpha/beta hydrolase [Guyparkeria sp. SB14A]